jgi:hypothetical protein
MLFSVSLVASLAVQPLRLRDSESQLAVTRSHIAMPPPSPTEIMAGPPRAIEDLFNALAESLRLTAPAQAAKMESLGSKFADAGVMFTSQLPKMAITAAYGISATPPPVPAGYVDSLQILAGFEFMAAEPPSAKLASSAGVRQQKGGPKTNILVSPNRGTAPLGEFLSKDAGDLRVAVADAFPRIEIFEPLIAANAASFFSGKPIKPGPCGDQLFSRIVIKVRPPRAPARAPARASARTPGLQFACAVLQQTIKHFGSLNIDKEYADKLCEHVGRLTMEGWPPECFIRLCDKDEEPKNMTATLINAFRAIKKRDRPALAMNEVNTAT